MGGGARGVSRGEEGGGGQKWTEPRTVMESTLAARWVYGFLLVLVFQSKEHEETFSQLGLKRGCFRKMCLMVKITLI